MKKSAFLLPILALGALSMTSCTSELKGRITYGTYIETKASEIQYVDLASKMANGENMLLSVYEDTGLPCGCWSAFHSVIDEYVETYHTKIYYIGRSQFSEDADTYGLTILSYENTAPTLAFMIDGKKSSEFIYGKNTEPMFTSLEGLRSAVKRIARDPVYMLVDQEYLDNQLFTVKASRTLVHYIWNFCPDCKDCFPYVLMPFASSNDLKYEILVIDLGVEGLLINNGTIDKTNENYVSFLKDHHMSAAGDEVFGYDRGFVPTTQVWENGVLKDMNVYFNDEISEENGKYVVSRTYFTEERVKNLKYTNEVLYGKEIAEEDLTIRENTDGTKSISWNKPAARKYHQPILESFLKMYAK